MSEGVPERLDELDIEIAAANQLYGELLAVLKEYRDHPKLSTFMVLGCLEAVKQTYYHVRCMSPEEHGL